MTSSSSRPTPLPSSASFPALRGDACEATAQTTASFVAVASGDNRNILASQKAKEIYGVQSVVTRVKDPLRADLFARLGLQTFSPTKAGIELAHDAIFDSAASPPREGR